MFAKGRWTRGIVWSLAVLACLVGGSASAYLTYEYVQTAPLAPHPDTQDDAVSDQETAVSAASVDGGGADEEGLMDRICTAYATWSCQEVSQSPYGWFPFHSEPSAFGAPTAELGLIFFIFVLAWLIFVGVPSASRWWLHFFFAVLTAFAVGFSLLLEYLMWFKLDFRCPFCILAHVAVGVLFIAALLLWPREAEAQTSPPRGGKPAKGERPSNPSNRTASPHPSARVVIATLAIALLGVGLQHMFWQNIATHRRNAAMADQLNTAKAGDACQKALKAQKWYVNYWQQRFRRYDDRWQNVVMNYSLEPVIPLVTEGEPFYGPADARHTIVIFSSPQCPACARLDKMLREQLLPMAERYGGAKVIYKHWPMSTDCNKYMTHNAYPNTCQTALAMEAAYIVGGREMFWKMHDALVAQRPRLKTADKEWFVNLAQGQVGLDPGTFVEAMDSEQAMSRIQAHIEEAQHLGEGILTGRALEQMKVDATPTVFVNNRPLPTWRHLRAWEEIFKRFPPQAASEATETQ